MYVSICCIIIIANCVYTFLDKNPHMSDFVFHIKSTSELNSIYESVQRDNSGMVSDNHTTPMEVGE